MIATLTAALALTTAPTSTEVTVYNQGFGFIKEVREMTLKAGRQTVGIEDVASLIDPTSVGFVSLSDPGSFHVLEQNYQYDLINPVAILNKSVGQRIRFIRTIGGAKDVLEGVLLSAPTAVVREGDQSQSTYNGMVIRTDDGRIVLDPTGEVEVRSVPAGLISKPTLVWDLEAAKESNQRIELSYITQGMSWNADYVLTLGQTDKADLQGWVTLNNNSGTTFENATLKLLAGEVNQAPRPEAALAMADAKTAFRFGAGAPMKEESLFEYHLYTLQRPATVRNKETKQLSLLSGQDVPFTKRIIFDAMMGYNGYYPNEGEVGVGNLHPQVRVEFSNTEKSGLGMPLPKGRFRIYQRDKSGSVQLLGEDNIDHTPKNESVSLVVGKSFDIVANRRRTTFNRINDRTVSESFEIEVRNRKESSESVHVYERHFGDWKVTSKSQEFTKLDANTADFLVTLKPNEVRKVTYTVETRW